MVDWRCRHVQVELETLVHLEEFDLFFLDILGFHVPQGVTPAIHSNGFLFVVKETGPDMDLLLTVACVGDVPMVIDGSGRVDCPCGVDDQFPKVDLLHFRGEVPRPHLRDAVEPRPELGAVHGSGPGVWMEDIRAHEDELVHYELAWREAEIEICAFVVPGNAPAFKRPVVDLDFQLVVPVSCVLEGHIITHVVGGPYRF